MEIQAKTSSEGVGNLAISDVHFGAVVLPEDTGGENVYNENVAGRRTVEAFRKFTESMKRETGGKVYDSCVVWLPGDIIESFRGRVTTEDGKVSYVSPNKSAELYSYVFSKELKKLQKAGVYNLVVVGVPGNHGCEGKETRDRFSETNYDLEFFKRLKERCEKQSSSENPEPPGPEIEVYYPGVDGTFVGEPIVHIVNGTPFILCHGDEPGFQVTLPKRDKAKTIGRDEVRRAGKNYLVGQIAHFKQKMANRAQVGQYLEDVDWDRSVLIHGHHHVACPDPDEQVLGCGALRGIDKHANRGQALLRLEEPSALTWTTLLDGSIVNVRKVRDLDPHLLSGRLGPTEVSLRLVRWGVSAGIKHYLSSKAA